MKRLNFVVLAAMAVLLVPAAASAQMGGSFGEEFVNAVRKSDGDKVTQLLRDHPAPLLVNARDSEGESALMVAVKRKDDEWTGFLLNQGADPNLASKGGDTPLIAASRVGYDQGAQWLISLGAKVDGANRQGETPLIVAVQAREMDTVRLLLKAGANPDRADSAQGYSARQYAERDPRARDILKAIEAARPKPTAAR